jgi:SAM-dependent methyltransferase
MHQAAHEWITQQVAMLPVRRSVLEFGARDVNGSPRPLFIHTDRYHGIDITDGPGVDQVADAATFSTPERFDTVICMEVLEHTDKAREICRNAHRHLLPHGVALFTAAWVGREPHSAVDGGTLHEGEFYRNVTVADLRFWLSDFPLVMLTTEGTDIYAIAIK